MSTPWLPGGPSHLELGPGDRWNTPSVDNPPSGIKVPMNGGWYLKPIKQWDGAAWVTKKLLYYDGAQWQLSTW